MEYTILAVARNKWGKGKTIQEALKAGNIKKTEHYAVQFSPNPEIKMDDMGCVCYPAGSDRTLITIGEFNKPKE